MKEAGKKQPVISQPPKDWKAEGRKKQKEAKRRAAEILKQSKTAAASKASKGKKKTQQVLKVQRKVMANHNLSESSDSD